MSHSLLTRLLLQSPIAGTNTVLPPATIITGVGFFVGWTGQNFPNSGDVLRYDDFVIETVSLLATE